MATVREGNKGVLLIVDVQVGVMRESWDAPRVIKNVALALERARAQDVPVIWVQHTNEDLVHASPQWQWVPELVPAVDEALIHKTFNSAYGALDRGYDLTLIQDAHSTVSLELDGGERIEAESVVKELNIAMTWLRYPGRTNGTATAAQIDFAKPGG